MNNDDKNKNNELKFGLSAEEKRDSYNRFKQHHEEEKGINLITGLAVIGLLYLFAKVGGSAEPSLLLAGILIAGIIGVFVWSSKAVNKAADNNGIPKAFRGSSNIREHSRKELEIQARYGFPRRGERGYEACEAELKKLRKEYWGDPRDKE